MSELSIEQYFGQLRIQSTNAHEDWQGSHSAHIVTAHHHALSLFVWESKGTPQMPILPGNKALLGNY